MLQHLVNHALQNVWCSPRQDNLHILQLHKLTAKYGVLGTVNVMGRDISLPNVSKRFHVYQIGQLSPAYVGLLTVKPSWRSETWTAFSAAINANNTQIDLYSEKGVMIPRFRSYYMFTNDRNLIVAIEINPKVAVDLDTESAFVRFYKNAFFSTVAGSATGEYLYHYGEIVASNDRIVKLSNMVREYKAKEGFTTFIVNGFVVDNLDSFTLKVGDVVEFVYDSTIYKVLTIKATDMKVFMSELDSCLKYIIHHKSLNDNYINYHDDIDIDVIFNTAPERLKGLTYHKNLLSNLRMITHRDYSIPVDNVLRSIRYIQELDSKSAQSVDGYFLRLKFKQVNPMRPLVYENNRIFELYKLADDKLLGAMVDIDSTVPNWTAATLESSMYTKIMGMRADDITLATVQEAYGYNAVTKIVADSPIATYSNSSRIMASLPIAYRINSEVYEYDADGNMLGHHYVSENDDYYARSSACKTVEPIVGKAIDNNGDVYGTDDLAIPKFDYRVYMAYINGGVLDKQSWRDITGSEFYTVEDGRLKWTNQAIDQWLCVRGDVNFYARDFEIKETSGQLFVKLTEMIDGEEVDMQVPRGEIDVFLNGKSLINELDYIVNFPYIYINNTKHLARPVASAVQTVHVRMTGFCKKDLSLEEADDFGFIEHGVLSNNNRFDVRDDKVLRITVNGALKTRADVTFSEDSTAVSVINALNGQPYQVKDYLIPIRDLINESSEGYRAKSQVIDETISKYLTLKHPETDRGPISANSDRYRVASPFMAKVTDLLTKGFITDDQIASQGTDMWIEEQLAPYMYLLDADPICGEYVPSEDFVLVVPHRYNNYVTISVIQFRFLTRVYQLYGKAPMQLNLFYLVNKEL